MIRWPGDTKRRHQSISTVTRRYRIRYGRVGHREIELIFRATPRRLFESRRILWLRAFRRRYPSRRQPVAG